MDHEAEDTHLGSAAVVKLDGLLGLLLRLTPSGVFHAINNVISSNRYSHGVVRLEAALFDILLLEVVAKLNETNEADDLSSSPSRDGVQSGKTGLHRGVWYTEGDVAGAAVPGSSDHVSDNCKHGNAAVLDLSVAELVELLLGSVLEKTQWIPEAERWDNSGLALVTHLQHGF